MFPEVTRYIRDAIKLRYSLLPYLYTLLYRAVVEDEPMIRPTFLDHEGDERCFEANDDFFLGDALLVASVVEKGTSHRRVYLPENRVGYYDFWTGRYYKGGQEINLPVTLESIPLFVKAGTILPLSPGVERSGSVKGQERHLVLYPLPKGHGGATSSLVYEDGIDNEDALSGNHQLTKMDLRCEADKLSLSWSRSGDFDPHLAGCRISVAGKDDRPVYLHGREIEQDMLLPF